VVGDADGAGAGQGLRHHHLDRVGAARRCQPILWVSRRHMPKPGTAQYEELEHDPEKAVFLRTITCHFQAILGITLLDVIMSSHSS
jgi:hypothetical protein